ncbi:MAG TPA: hypothetical protein VND89_10445 [Acidimicrobiales bacterium]|nr:hypothetical protein [Acidimicrobiales bacterium]
MNVLLAPFDGVISKVLAAAGEQVVLDQPLVRIAVVRDEAPTLRHALGWPSLEVIRANGRRVGFSDE